MLVSFIIVAYNAGQKLIRVLRDLRDQDYNHGKIEVLLVDGDSDDNTKQLMKDFAATDHGFSRVRVLDNPRRILPCGWNIALKESNGDVIIRVDAHASIPRDFISKNVQCIRAGEKIVGGRRISIADETSTWQRTLLIAETSLFGSGIAQYRRGRQKKYVSTLAHAAYSREVFEKVGGYDERLTRTEDNEIHYRMKKAGYRFRFDPKIISYHLARNTLPKMLKQKFLNGYWIGLTLGISPFCFSLYHFAPLLFVLLLIGTALLALIGSSLPLMMLAGSYGVLAAVITIFLSIDGKPLNARLLLLPFLFFLLHAFYGLGTLWGFISLPKWFARNNQSGFSVAFK